MNLGAVGVPIQVHRGERLQLRVDEVLDEDSRNTIVLQVQRAEALERKDHVGRRRVTQTHVVEAQLLQALSGCEGRLGECEAELVQGD